MSEDTRAGLPLAYGLPARYYIEPGIFQKETDAIFNTCWHLVAHRSQVPEPGDYLSFTIGDQELFIVRDGERILHGFYNVCRHRGHQLLAGEGNCRVIACPYHAWTYELDGRLRKARNQDEVAGFDPGSIRLSPVRLDDFCGFIFVNLDEQAAPMSELYPGVAAEIEAFAPEVASLEYAHCHRAELDANWKVAVENYNECYHCRVVHSAFAQGVVDPDSYRVETHGRHFRHRAGGATNSAYQYDKGAAEHAEEYSSWYLWPLASIQVYPGNVVNTYRWLPVGAEKTVVLREWFLPRAQPTDEEWKLIELDRTTTFQEDIDLMTSVQKGLHSRGYTPGPLMIDPSGNVNSEHPVYEIQQMVRAALDDNSGEDESEAPAGEAVHG